MEASLEEADAALGNNYRERTLSPLQKPVGGTPAHPPPLPWSLTVERRGALVYELEEFSGRGLHRLFAGPAAHGHLGEGSALNNTDYHPGSRDFYPNPPK